MGSRKPIPKNTRFEVFKRDSFKCQYCGRSAPEVILEVDHILPVAEGGDNSVLNLITSCRDCNRGKSKVKLDDNTTIMKQKRELDELNEKREQVEMLQAWRSELKNLNDKMLETALNAVYEYTGPLSEHLQSLAEDKLTRAIRDFGLQETCEAIDISFRQYHVSTFYSIRDAICKIGGICYNRRRNKHEHTITITLSEMEYNYFNDWLQAGGSRFQSVFTFTDFFTVISSMYEDECQMEEFNAKPNS